MIRSAILGAVAVVALGVGGFTLFGGTGSGVSLPVTPANAQTAAADVDTSIVEEMTLGEADAPVTVIEYASFTCPHCRRFHEGPFKQLKADYIDTGKVQFVYREVYFDRYGLWAGMVASCGGPVRYFGLVDLIYERQAEWTASNDPAQIAENLRGLGRIAGLTNEQLDACLTDGEKAQAMVALWQQRAEADDINSTPSFLIDGVKYGNMNYADFSRILDEKLGE